MSEEEAGVPNGFHWSEGGDSITNISDEDKIPLYEKAIEEYGDENLFIAPYPDHKGLQGWSSLRYKNHPGLSLDLHEFWKIFRKITEQD